MTVNNDAIRKMYIEVDTDKITDSTAKKLTKLLQLCEMELGTDGWYSGTNEHVKMVYDIIIGHDDIFKSLKKWIWWNPDNNAREDCIAEHYLFEKKYGKLKK